MYTMTLATRLSSSVLRTAGFQVINKFVFTELYDNTIIQTAAQFHKVAQKIVEFFLIRHQVVQKNLNPLIDIPSNL
jgi:hypothetical protein